MKFNFYKSISTFFGLGFVSPLPGTLTSFLTLVIIWTIQTYFGIKITILFILFITLIGYISVKKNPNNKSIIFTQFRSTVSKICQELNKIPGIRAMVFVGQTKKTNKKGEESGLSQKEQSQIIEDFKSGEINILCATSIAEEGLDIPEVNSVFFYEPVPSAIRKIQRAGRTARLREA